MVTQTIRVDLNRKDLETIQAVQNDTLREIAFDFYATDAEDAVQLDPDEFTVKFNVLKPDNNFVMTTFTDGVIKLSDQITAVTGTGYYCILLMQNNELIYSGNGKIIINDHVIGSENIDSVSEADGYTFPGDFYTKDTPLAVLDDSTTSTTSTWSSEKISEEIASIPGPDIIDDTVTSTEKTWSSSKISTEVEAAAASEIDDNTTATDSTWSSEKIAEEISEVTPTITKEVTGNPVEFTDGADAPLVKCVTQITGYQEGTGTPSPDNVRRIVAYTEGEIEVSDGDGNTTTHTTTYPSAIYRGSEDVVNGEVTSEWVVYVINSFTGAAESNGFRTGIVLPNVSGAYGELYCNMFDRAGSYNEAVANEDLPEQRNKIGFNASGGVLLNAYVNGAYVTSVQALNALLPPEGCVIAYKLATPTTTPVTPTNLPIKSLSGYNHIESSTGEMEVEYIVDDYQPIIDCIPAGPIYSTDEQITGTWTDGRPVYTRIIPVNATWQNIGTTSRQSFVYLQDWAKQIDLITDLFIIGKDQYYGYTFNAAANLDRGSGSIEACWNDPFGGLLTSVPVECVRMSYVKTASVSRNLQRISDVNEVKELQDPVLEERREEEYEDELHDKEVLESRTDDTNRE